MRYLIWFAAIIILLLIQTALIPFRVYPAELCLVLVVVSLLFADFNFGLILALTCGLMLDFLSGSADGVMAVTFVTIFLGLYFVINFVLAKDPNLLILFSTVAVATLAYFILLSGYNKFFGLMHLGTIVNYQAFWTQDLPKSLIFNLILTYPILIYYTYIESINKKFRKHDPEPIRN